MMIKMLLSDEYHGKRCFAHTVQGLACFEASIRPAVSFLWVTWLKGLVHKRYFWI
jgi:hypothetical protein